jgi:CBS domain-containing protein
MNSHVEILPATTRLQDIPRDVEKAFLAADASGDVMGAITARSLAGLGDRQGLLADIVQHNYVIVSPSDSLWAVVAAMRSTDLHYALVVLPDLALKDNPPGAIKASAVKGLISRNNIIDTLAVDVDLFGV